MKKIEEFNNLINKAVEEGAFPGANYAIVFKDKAVIGSFGNKALYPALEANDIDTIYDMASLSKVVSTTTCALKLIEDGLLRICAPVKKYIPEFKHDGVTVYHLMTHTSGLPEGVSWKGIKSKEEIFDRIFELDLKYETASGIHYSDVGYILLGKIVETISGRKLNEFAKSEIFDKLEMFDTGYLPTDIMRCAPTELRCDEAYNGYVRGSVHDETSYALGGVAGHAGLFSTVKDMVHFLQMMLNDGIYKGEKILSKQTIDMLFTPQVEETKGIILNYNRRSIGWINRGYGSSAGELTSENTILHTGFTGTNIWIDRTNEVAFVLLTNRVHPSRTNLLHMDVRARLANFIIAHLDEIKNEK